VPELAWQVSRSAPTAATAVDGVAQLLLLLPDLVPSSSSSSADTAAAAAADLHSFASGELLLSSAGHNEVQQAVLTSLKLLQRVLGSGLAEEAQGRALEMLTQQQRRVGLAGGLGFGSARGIGNRKSGEAGAGSFSRLCLIGLLAPEKLGFAAAEGEVCCLLSSFCVVGAVQL
jgi:hypothetical protein